MFFTHWQVPVAAAAYYDDMNVNFKQAMETASQIAGIRLMITNEYLHSGLDDPGSRVFDYLMGMLNGKKPLFWSASQFLHAFHIRYYPFSFPMVHFVGYFRLIFKKTLRQFLHVFKMRFCILCDQNFLLKWALVEKRHACGLSTY